MANEFVHATVGTAQTQDEFEAVGLHVCNSQATGDLIYASSATQLTRLGIGATNAILTVIGGIPTWQTSLSGLTLVSSVLSGTFTNSGTVTFPAVTLGGTLTLGGQVFDAGAGSMQVNTTAQYGGLTFQKTWDGADGAFIILYHVSASPADADVVGELRFNGVNDNVSPETLVYGYISVVEADVSDGVETGTFNWTLKNAGADNLAMTLAGSGALWTDLSVDTLTYKVSGTQVVGARVVDARCDDAINSGDATTDGVIDALRDAMITHGLVAAA